ncbi:MAG TPA: GNAT family N-acetyltransferase [Longimicrobiaceae bacterium]
MAPGYELRQATDADFEFLWHLHRAAMRPYVERTWGWDEDAQARRFRAAFDPSHRQIVIVGGEPIGVLQVDDLPRAVFLANVEIDPAHQRRGLGRALVESVLDRARSLGMPVTLQVLRVNPVRRLYERLGFRVTGETPTHYLMLWEPGETG